MMKILVIDDSPDRQSRFVRELLGCQLTTAENPDDAIRIIGAAMFDVIFLDGDLSLRGREGLDIARHLSRSVNSKTRVIVHSMNISLAKQIKTVLSICDLIPFNDLKGKIRSLVFPSRPKKVGT
jgi:CheY-like chemotaxis protein